MRTSHKAKDAAAEKQSYACDTFTGHGKGAPAASAGLTGPVFPVMLLGKADFGGSACGHERTWPGKKPLVLSDLV